MSIGDNRLEGLAMDVTVGDLWGARDVSGRAKLARADVGGESAFRHPPDRDKAPRRGERTLGFAGTVRGFALKARGRLAGCGPPIRLDLATLTAQGKGRSLALAGPATLTYDDGAVDIRNFALRVDSGRLALSRPRRPRPRICARR